MAAYEYAPAKFFQRLILPLLVALLALAVCGGALATSNPVKVTVDLTGHASFEETCNATLPGLNFADVTELVITGQSTRPNESDTKNDWKHADRDYLKNKFVNLETLDISGHTGGYSVSAFEECKFKNVRLRDNIALEGNMFAHCTNLTTLAVGNRDFTPDVIDLNGCDPSSLRNGEFHFFKSGIIRVRLPTDIDLTVTGRYFSPFADCSSLTT